MVAKQVGSGGLQPPEPFATRHKASQPLQPSSPLRSATSPACPNTVGAALDAAALALSVQTADARVSIAGIGAKALIALAAAKSRGLCQSDASSWSAQLGSAVRDLRRLGFPVRTIRGDWRRRIATRYVLECAPYIAVIRLTPRSGAQ